MVKLGSYSPWGKIQHAKTVAEGIDVVDTSSHGGYKLSRQRNAQMPKPFRNSGGWYEEDCEYALVVITFPNLFKEHEVQYARQIAKNFFPQQYEEVTGEIIPLEESSQKRRDDFNNKHKDSWVVCAAWGDWHSQVPKGMAAVLARRHEEERYFLVPLEEYQGRSEFGFVINPRMHKEIQALGTPF